MIAYFFRGVTDQFIDLLLSIRIFITNPYCQRRAGEIQDSILQNVIRIALEGYVIAYGGCGIN